MKLLDMAANFTASVTEWVKAGAPLVSEEQFKERVTACQACEFFDAKAFGGKGRCMKCGCSSYKLFLATSRCPLDKWQAIPDPTAAMVKRCRKKERAVDGVQGLQ